MVSLFDCEENLKNELENTKEIKLNEVKDKYTESDLMFVLTGNRMSGDAFTMMFYKNNEIEICTAEEVNDDFVNLFPITYSTNYNANKSNDKYEFYECGFGSILYVDKKINTKFYTELVRLAKINEVDFYNDLPNETFIYSYWITIAKNIFK